MILEPQSKFTVDEVEEILGESSFKLSTKAAQKCQRAFDRVQALAVSNEAIYGVNTGFGRLAQVKISGDSLYELQVNLLRSHASGMGEPTSEEVVRRLLLLRAISLGKSYSGLSPQMVQRHLDYLNHDLIPWIPVQGSVGASGDLAPLAHLGLTFMGEGAFRVGDRKLKAAAALKAKKLKPLTVYAKEGLALINGTQFSLALSLQVMREIKDLWPWMLHAIAVSVEGHRATDSVYREDLHSLKAHPHQQMVAKQIRDLLKGSQHMKSHEDCEIVQDAYSFRCIPQVMGPCLSILERAEEILQDEVNSVSDNPVLIGSELVSGGHFHAQSVSMASDLLTMAMVTMGNLLERRVDQVVNPSTTRSASFLADRPGVESGLMIVHTALSALASENKTLAFPASADTISTNGNQEDHVSMAPWAARKAHLVVTNLRRMVAGEILCGVRACVLESRKSKASFAPAVEKFLKQLQSEVPSLFRSGDRVFSDDLQQLEELMS